MLAGSFFFLAKENKEKKMQQLFFRKIVILNMNPGNKQVEHVIDFMLITYLKDYI